MKLPSAALAQVYFAAAGAQRRGVHYGNMLQKTRQRRGSQDHSRAFGLGNFHAGLGCQRGGISAGSQHHGVNFDFVSTGLDGTNSPGGIAVEIDDVDAGEHRCFHIVQTPDASVDDHLGFDLSFVLAVFGS